MLEEENNMNKTEEFVFIGFWKRVLTKLIDAAISWIFIPITMPLMYWEIKNRSIMFTTTFSIVWTLIFLYLVVKFGGTPGKLLIKARIVNKNGDYLDWKRAILRALPAIIISINTVLLLYNVANSYVELPMKLTFLELGKLYQQHGGMYNKLQTIIGLFVCVDYGAVLFNKKKRAIHDFIAGSFVVTKKSYLETKNL